MSARTNTRTNDRIDYFISDPHFNWKNGVEKYKCPDGSPLRNFSSIEEMNKTIIDNINSLVRPQDRLFLLGDCTVNAKNIGFIDEIICKNLHLIGGNHDDGKLEEYTKRFRSIMGAREYGDKHIGSVILTHMPVHPSCIKPRFQINVHGHEHLHVINNPDYVSVCVEQTNYMPITAAEIGRRHKLNVHRFIKTGEVINFALENA